MADSASAIFHTTRHLRFNEAERSYFVAAICRSPNGPERTLRSIALSYERIISTWTAYNC